MTEEKERLFGQFENIFKRKVRPLIMRYLENDWCTRSMLYTIESGRNRFRAGLAYLLSGQKREGVVIGAASEVAWAAILILDDIGDNTSIRRGKESAWRKFGLLEAAHAATLGFIISKRILEEEKTGDPLIKSLEESIVFTLQAQIEQKTFNCQNASVETVLDNYDRKTALGRWPVGAAITINDELSLQEKEKIQKFPEVIAIAAQIRNDLDDIAIGVEKEKYEPAMKDLQEQIVNYPVALLLNRVTEDDKQSFLDKCREQKTTGESEAIKCAIEMFAKYNIYNQCEIEINKRVSSAVALIRDLPRPYRVLLKNWAESYRKEVK